MQQRRVIAGVGLALAAACGSSHDIEQRDGGAEGVGVTFQAQVRPLIEAHCASCHKEGGIAPFALGYDADEWKDGPPSWAAQAVAAVQARSMPPWMPDPDCHPLDYARRLSDDQVAVFKAWADDGFTLGDERDYVPPQEVNAVSLGEPTRELAPAEPYTPKTERPDDYHCFLLPDTFQTESYLVATNVTPGVLHEVHHVILYNVDAAQVADAEALDAAEEGAGYTCFGGPGVNGAQNVGGWVPGMVPSVAPAESARVLPAGSRIIMQIHYNTSHSELGVHADQTRAQLWLTDSAPTYRITTVPVANLQIRIPANEAESVQTRTFTVPMAGTVVGVLPHMHTRGKRIEVSLKREGEDDMCLVRIPAWDFHWQQGYRYREEAYVEVTRGDQLELTCVYDNSGTDHEVTWGEGTDDEMCLNYLEVRSPFAGNRLVDKCPGYRDCVDACDEGSTVCFMQCTLADASCQECTGSALARCAVGTCQDQGIALQACLGECAGDAACTRANCADESLAFFGCMEPVVRAGSCDAALDRCGT